MIFYPILLKDLDIIRPFFSKPKSRICDYTVGGMFMWRDFYKMEFSVDHGELYTRLLDLNGNVYYNLPLCDDVVCAIKRLKTEVSSSFKLYTVPREYLETIKNNFCVRFYEQPNFSDYLYKATDLISFSGRKYSGQRNQINQFRRQICRWSFKMIDGSLIDSVIGFQKKMISQKSDVSSFEMEEDSKTLEVLRNYDLYNLKGGCLFAGDRIVGFSVNEVIGDTLFTHIEKADRNVKGAFQMLVNQNAISFVSENVVFINREEDMGEYGLRKSKESYHPIEKLKKYIIEVF